jgi:hypothetical protein
MCLHYLTVRFGLHIVQCGVPAVVLAGVSKRNDRADQAGIFFVWLRLFCAVRASLLEWYTMFDVVPDFPDDPFNSM